MRFDLSDRIDEVIPDLILSMKINTKLKDQLGMCYKENNELIFLNTAKSFSEQNVKKMTTIIIFPIEKTFLSVPIESFSSSKKVWCNYSKKKNNEKKRYCVLYWHYLIYGKGESGNPMGVITIDNKKIAIDDSKITISRAMHMNYFILNDMTHFLVIDDPKLKKEFPRALKNCSESSGNTVFGVSMNQLMARKAIMVDFIPYVVSKSIAYLDKESSIF